MLQRDAECRSPDPVFSRQVRGLRIRNEQLQRDYSQAVRQVEESNDQIEQFATSLTATQRQYLERWGGTRFRPSLSASPLCLGAGLLTTLPLLPLCSDAKLSESQQLAEARLSQGEHLQREIGQLKQGYQQKVEDAEQDAKKAKVAAAEAAERLVADGDRQRAEFQRSEAAQKLQVGAVLSKPRVDDVLS